MEVAEPARRPGHQFVGVDLRRPKGYAPAAATQEQAPAKLPAGEGDPCPRCGSRDTKFCYYNNYNTAQPRHFCKGCRRYWTKGGTLRNVPVGGGTRKRPSSSSAASSAPSSAVAAKPKALKSSKKKRRVTAPEAPAPAPVAADSAKTTTTTDTTSEVTAELAAPAAPAAAAEEEESLAHLLQPFDAAAVAAIGLGMSELPGGKGSLLEPTDSFEWPASFDLGACWGGAAFADPDPALFLNFP